MDDLFGEPLFQPTGTDWIDHAFTAAILDEEEADSDAAAPARHPSVSAPAPKMTPELREALMKDPKTRDVVLQIDKTCNEISDMVRRAQRGWF